MSWNWLTYLLRCKICCAYLHLLLGLNFRPKYTTWRIISGWPHKKLKCREEELLFIICTDAEEEVTTHSFSFHLGLTGTGHLPSEKILAQPINFTLCWLLSLKLSPNIPSPCYRIFLLFGKDGCVHLGWRQLLQHSRREVGPAHASCICKAAHFQTSHGEWRASLNRGRYVLPVINGVVQWERLAPQLPNSKAKSYCFFPGNLGKSIAGCDFSGILPNIHYQWQTNIWQ